MQNIIYSKPYEYTKRKVLVMFQFWFHNREGGEIAKIEHHYNTIYSSKTVQC